jgi:hypothetical protein
MIRGIAGDKESVPAVVRVLVTPVNDEPPHIANNTGLILWEGSTAIITSTHLGKLQGNVSMNSKIKFSLCLSRYYTIKTYHVLK